MTYGFIWWGVPDGENNVKLYSPSLSVGKLVLHVISSHQSDWETAPSLRSKDSKLHSMTAELLQSDVVEFWAWRMLKFSTCAYNGQRNMCSHPKRKKMCIRPFPDDAPVSVGVRKEGMQKGYVRERNGCTSPISAWGNWLSWPHWCAISGLLEDFQELNGWNLMDVPVGKMGPLHSCPCSRLNPSQLWQIKPPL